MALTHRTAWIMLLALAQAMAADESAVRLKEAAGRDLVQANCVACHSLDYIQMNSPFLDRKGWEASVNKMIRAMGAPIAEADARAIVDYLATHYSQR